MSNRHLAHTHTLHAEFDGDSALAADLYPTYPRAYLTAHLDDGIMEAVTTNWGNEGIQVDALGPSLLGRYWLGIGPAQRIGLTSGLYFDLLGNLAYDASPLQDQITALQQQQLADETSLGDGLAALTAVVTARLANDETLIAANTAAITALQAALSDANAQIASLQRQIIVIMQTAVFIPAASAQFAGTGNLTTSLRRIGLFAALPFDGTGTLAVNAIVSKPIEAAFAGAGGLSADISGPHLLGTFLFAGTGVLACDVITIRPLGQAPNLSGISGLSAGLVQRLTHSASLTGSGALAADVYRSSMLATARMTGAGSLVANILRDATFISATCAGVGGFSAKAAYRLAARATYAGVGALGAGLTVSLGNSKWNPADKDVNAVLSSGNAVLTATSVPSGARGTQSRNSGKRYFTVNLGLALTGQAGLATTAAPLDNILGGDANGWGIFTPTSTYRLYHNATTIPTAVAAADNDVLNVAYDAGSGNIWLGINGVYFDSTGASTGNPVAGTSPTYTVAASTALFPIGIIEDLLASLTINTAPSGAPSGFTNWG